MKRFFLYLMAFTLLTMTADAAVVGGAEMGFGQHIDGVGAAIVMGTQEVIDSNTIVRAMFSKVNYGAELDNVGAMMIHYWPLDFYKGLKIGSRISADYEVESSNVGIATGVELCKTLFGPDLQFYLNFDIVKRVEIDNYFSVGAGIILLK